MFTYLTFRNGVAHYMRRVPKQYARIDKRNFVKKSLKTRDPQEALRKALNYNEYLERFWESQLHEGNLSPEANYELAATKAKVLGLTYKTAEEISNSDISGIVNRLLLSQNSIDSSEEISAILGGEKYPSKSLGDLWAEFYEFKKSSLLGKSAQQRKRWVNPRIRAYKTFIEVCGNIPVESISRDHILTFRKWWSDRVQKGMAANSANKDFTHLRSLLAYAQDNWRGIPFDVTSLFARVRFEEGDSDRKPFDTQYIRENLLNPALLRGLSNECRYFLFAMADTGARPSELLGLNAERGDIRLDGNIPFIHIQPTEQREIKNKYSNRQLPLVGASLHAFRNLPNGFYRYFERPDQLSSNLNKFLRERGLLPSSNHTVYSLRHSFEDRLCEVDTPEKVQSCIMGHSYRRERYGNGPTLKQKRKWMQKMCFSEFEI